MHYEFRNVNVAFYGLVRRIHAGLIQTRTVPSRVGDIMTVEEPVIVTYMRPQERVLFNEYRDANPFFHLYESLWMLAGMNTLAPLKTYVANFGNYSDDGKTLWGAYGFRWRHWFDDDQVAMAIEELSRDKNSRRVVIGMWDPGSDSHKAVKGGKDVPCNVCIMLRVIGDCLDMTVCNRSNDLVLGMLGANVVHMSFLQEYMALSLGLAVGNYHQMTNNLHVYTENWRPEEWLNWYLEDQEDKIRLHHYEGMNRVPLLHGDNRAEFDREIHPFVSAFSSIESGLSSEHTVWDVPFFDKVARPALLAHAIYKDNVKSVDNVMRAISITAQIVADDWRLACANWLKKRLCKLTKETV